jgi:hypothetical protein
MREVGGRSVSRRTPAHPECRFEFQLRPGIWRLAGLRFRRTGPPRELLRTRRRSGVCAASPDRSVWYQAGPTSSEAACRCRSSRRHGTSAPEARPVWAPRSSHRAPLDSSYVDCSFPETTEKPRARGTSPSGPVGVRTLWPLAGAYLDLLHRAGLLGGSGVVGSRHGAGVVAVLAGRQGRLGGAVDRLPITQPLIGDGLRGPEQERPEQVGRKVRPATPLPSRFALQIVCPEKLAQ